MDGNWNLAARDVGFAPFEAKVDRHTIRDAFIASIALVIGLAESG